MYKSVTQSMQDGRYSVAQSKIQDEKFVPLCAMYVGHFFNMATIQENVTLLHSTALAMNAVRM